MVEILKGGGLVLAHILKGHNASWQGKHCSGSRRPLVTLWTVMSEKWVQAGTRLGYNPKSQSQLPLLSIWVPILRDPQLSKAAIPAQEWSV